MITMAHIRRAGYCAAGARAWFAAKGLDWSAFLRHGVAVEVFEATGDAMAIRVARIARAEVAHG